MAEEEGMVPAVKLLVTYEVKDNSGADYHKFIMGHYLPTLQSLGLQMSEAWYTAYGDAPNRMMGFVSPDKGAMNEMLVSDTWYELTETLSGFVDELDYKVIPYKQGFQI